LTDNVHGVNSAHCAQPWVISLTALVDS